MPKMNKLFADPIHGFIEVKEDLVLAVIQSPEVQRLRRIRQMGTAYLVFPSGEHSRFGHALGTMALMQDALKVLIEKGIEISPQEAEAAQIAALLHDIGHGPFSHTLENVFFQNPEFRHEQMSWALMNDLNERFEGKLTIALQIFNNTYPKTFLHELISGQLDVDRLDYLRRDAHFTGVVEGMIGVERIIKTLHVHQGKLVVEAKGGYAVENYLLARRQMYGQVYLHKTVYAADFMLESMFKRRRKVGAYRQESEALLFFLDQHPNLQEKSTRERFLLFDDNDILQAIKNWLHHPDKILRVLAEMFLNRRFFKTYLFDFIDQNIFEELSEQVLEKLKGIGIENTDTLSYFMGTKPIRIKGYDAKTPIRLLFKDGNVASISDVSNAEIIKALQKEDQKQALMLYPI